MSNFKKTSGKASSSKERVISDNDKAMTEIFFAQQLKIEAIFKQKKEEFKRGIYSSLSGLGLTDYHIATLNQIKEDNERKKRNAKK